MSVSHTFRVKPALVAVLSVVAWSARAEAQNVDAMAKWTALTIVHYRIVGEFDAEVPLFSGASTRTFAKAIDRVEIEFDWDQNEMKMVGKATFKNFPTTFTPNPRPNCPPAKFDGVLEQATVLSVKDTMPGTGTITIDVKRDVPGGAVPWTEDNKPCGTLWDKIAPKTETKQDMLQVVPAMMLAMPGMTTADGKSLVVKAPKTGGWTWTLTPTPVK